MPCCPFPAPEKNFRHCVVSAKCRAPGHKVKVNSERFMSRTFTMQGFTLAAITGKEKTKLQRKN